MYTFDTALQKRLKRYIARLLKRPEDIEDVSQEAFLKLLESAGKGEIHYPKAYLFRTARNLALNNLARKSNILVDSLEDSANPDVLGKTGMLEDQMIIQQRFKFLSRAVANLPELTRQVLILRKYQGLSRKEVASALNISVSAVEKHLARAIESCIHYMEICGYRSGVKSTDGKNHEERRVIP